MERSGEWEVGTTRRGKSVIAFRYDNKKRTYTTVEAEVDRRSTSYPATSRGPAPQAAPHSGRSTASEPSSPSKRVVGSIKATGSEKMEDSSPSVTAQLQQRPWMVPTAWPSVHQRLYEEGDPRSQGVVSTFDVVREAPFVVNAVKTRLFLMTESLAGGSTHGSAFTSTVSLLREASRHAIALLHRLTLAPASGRSGTSSSLALLPPHPTVSQTRGRAAQSASLMDEKAKREAEKAEELRLRREMAREKREGQLMAIEDEAMRVIRDEELEEERRLAKQVEMEERTRKALALRLERERQQKERETMRMEDLLSYQLEMMERNVVAFTPAQIAALQDGDSARFQRLAASHKHNVELRLPLGLASAMKGTLGSSIRRAGSSFAETQRQEMRGQAQDDSAVRVGGGGASAVRYLRSAQSFHGQGEQRGSARGTGTQGGGGGSSRK